MAVKLLMNDYYSNYYYLEYLKKSINSTEAATKVMYSF